MLHKIFRVILHVKPPYFGNFMHHRGDMEICDILDGISNFWSHVNFTELWLSPVNVTFPF